MENVDPLDPADLSDEVFDDEPIVYQQDAQIRNKLSNANDNR